MQRIIFCCFILLFGASCKRSFNYAAQPGEGMIVYRVSYPDSSKFGMKYTFFPKEIILVFKNEKAAFITEGGFGLVQLVNLLDHKNQKYTSLLIDNLRENFGCTLTPSEIKVNEDYPKYKFQYTEDKKTIAGVECKKAIAANISSNSTFEIYFNDKIRFYYSNSPFKDFNCLMMEYSHTVNNLTMKLVATKVDLTTPVDTTLFNVKGNYRWVNQKEFYEHLGQL